MESKDLMQKIVKLLDDKKAHEIMVLDISEITTMADYFVICNGNSTIHLKSLADEIEEKNDEIGVHYLSKEGFQTATWILMDYGSVVVHIFNDETREFYSIENLWADAKNIDITEFLD